MCLSYADLTEKKHYVKKQKSNVECITIQTKLRLFCDMPHDIDLTSAWAYNSVNIY